MYDQVSFESDSRAALAVFWGGLWVAIGAFGVVITSVLYAISPALAVLPIANVPLAEARQAAVAGQQWMLAAGSVGLFADVALATGAFLLMVYRRPGGSGSETPGWAWLAITNLIFVVVDALVSQVLAPVAASGGPEGAFSGFKHLSDILFIIGTITFGIGSISVLWSEVRSGSPVVPRVIGFIGIAVGGVGLVSALSYFAGINLAQFIGGTIGAGSLIFTIVGIQIARTALLTMRANTHPAPRLPEQQKR
ncbi:MAG: hypothetical protein IMW89_10725 [Ktedonobacteraceae bacterium]|nr:hypothetical protein [Ktedonobacteraceae bacterium]